MPFPFATPGTTISVDDFRGRENLLYSNVGFSNINIELGFSSNAQYSIDSVPGRTFIDNSIPKFQGVVAGYISGGESPSPPFVARNNIEKFPFATNANSTDVGDLTVARGGVAGQSSTVSGYTSGGRANAPPPITDYNIIDKFPFASNANATDVGDLTRSGTAGAGQSSTVSGYTSGAPASSTIIDKFPFASNANATDVGDLTQGRTSQAGQSSTVSGYNSGGFASTVPGSVNTIDKFPFATDANATDVGDLTLARRPSGQSSTVSGYTSGGADVTIDKFPFATDANATDVGDLLGPVSEIAGQSSFVSGYVSGGSPLSIIQKFPFATNANSTDVGDLIVNSDNLTGQQD